MNCNFNYQLYIIFTYNYFYQENNYTNTIECLSPSAQIIHDDFIDKFHFWDHYRIAIACQTIHSEARSPKSRGILTALPSRGRSRVWAINVCTCTTPPKA